MTGSTPAPAGPFPKATPWPPPRAETDQTVVANLLRLNLARAEPAP